MRTAVDTNVPSKILHGLPLGLEAAEMMAEAQAEGALVLCPVVYAELLASPSLDSRDVHAFLKKCSISVDDEMGLDVWEEAGRRFGAFCVRRKQSGGGEERRLLADFVIGAHALLSADRLLTFDINRYRADFPELKLMSLREM